MVNFQCCHSICHNSHYYLYFFYHRRLTSSLVIKTFCYFTKWRHVTSPRQVATSCRLTVMTVYCLVYRQMPIKVRAPCTWNEALMIWDKWGQSNHVTPTRFSLYNYFNISINWILTYHHVFIDFSFIVFEL